MSFETRLVTGTAQVPLVNAGDGQTLISNGDQNNTIYLSHDYGAQASSLNTIPLLPGGFLTFDGKTTVYGVCSTGQSANAYVIPGGLNFFQLVTLIVKTIIIAASFGNGLFVYSGAPAAGDLIYSITPASENDPHTNLTPSAGGISYLTVGAHLVAVAQNGNALTFYTATTEAGPWTSQGSLTLSNIPPFVLTLNGTQLVLSANLGTITLGVSVTFGVTFAGFTEMQSGLWLNSSVSLTGAPASPPATGAYIWTETVDNQIWEQSQGGRFNFLDDIDIAKIGKGLRVAEGANAKQNRNVTLVAGSAVVANTSITANSLVVPGFTTGGASVNAGALFVTNQVAGTGFTIKSTNAADTSVVGYEIFEAG